jgi:hypothetical protein
MRLLFLGAHASDAHVRGIAEPVACGAVWLSGVAIGDDVPLADRELVLAAARTRAELLERATFIAIRYGFAGSPDEGASKCAAHAARWKRILDANQDNVEMTLKVVAAHPKPRPRREDFAHGADYLRALHASAAEVDPRFREAVSAIGEHRWSHRDSRSLECALLVPRAGVARVQAKGEQLKRDFPGIPFLLSGPWPLEAFVDHE